MMRFPGRRPMAVLAVLAVLAAAGPAGAAPEGTLTWGLHVTLASKWLDPAETEAFINPFMVLYAIHDALVKPMPGGDNTPSLAESWTASKDGLTYEFVLRKGVRFHNGDPVTAEDVKYSFDRYKGAAAKLLKDKVREVEIVDPGRVRFRGPLPAAGQGAGPEEAGSAARPDPADRARPRDVRPDLRAGVPLGYRSAGRRGLRRPDQGLLVLRALRGLDAQGGTVARREVTRAQGDRASNLRSRACTRGPAGSPW
jgi:hypothetical protein